MNRQVLGLTEDVKPTVVATRCMVPTGKIRSARLTFGGSLGRLGTGAIWPTPSNTPLATITVLITVLVPEAPEVTMVPLTVSLPLMAAAAGVEPGSAEMAIAVPGGQHRACHLSFHPSASYWPFARV